MGNFLVALLCLECAACCQGCMCTMAHADPHDRRLLQREPRSPWTAGEFQIARVDQICFLLARTSVFADHVARLRLKL